MLVLDRRTRAKTSLLQGYGSPSQSDRFHCPSSRQRSHHGLRYRRSYHGLRLRRSHRELTAELPWAEARPFESTITLVGIGHNESPTKRQRPNEFEPFFSVYESYKRDINDKFKQDWMYEYMCDGIFIGSVDVRLRQGGQEPLG